MLASFLSGIANDGGWWYRMPKMTKSVAEKEATDMVDKILPHFGSVFGLTEEAAALVLELMECVSINKTTQQTKIRRQGFEDLGSEFKVDNLIEVKASKIDGKSHWFIRLGMVSEEALFPLRI